MALISWSSSDAVESDDLEEVEDDDDEELDEDDDDEEEEEVDDEAVEPSEPDGAGNSSRFWGGSSDPDADGMSSALSWSRQSLSGEPGGDERPPSSSSAITEAKSDL